MGSLVATQAGGPITHSRKTKTKKHCLPLKDTVAMFSGTVMLFCRSILFHLGCSCAANEWQMRSYEAVRSAVCWAKV